MRKIKRKRLLTFLTGGVVGLINGLLGGGGGMISVPLLEKGLKEDVKVSHATTVLIIFPICIASAIVYWTSGKFAFEANVPIILGVIVGGVIGSVLLKKLKGRIIAVAFALLMIFAGARMAF
ncbi:MAG: sulfite exporter TauE/SafE family protein [Clostridia bacterium]|nr:sulfite exporter TauE/SafE family protein [Clostridia bacterium]